MTPEIQQAINSAIQTYAQQQQFGVATVPFHDHNGINSPTIKSPITSYMGQVGISGGAGSIFPQGWTVTETAIGQYTIVHNLGYTDKNYTVFASSVDVSGTYSIVNATTPDYQNQFVIQWTQLVTPLIFFTGGLSAGATSGTLTGNWTAGPTAVYYVTFSNGDVRSVTLTNGATSATWSGGLSSAVSTRISVSLFSPASFMFTIIVGSTSTNVA